MPASTLQIRVPFVDTDASQRIHFTAWFRYMEFAEHQLMRDLGIPYATSGALGEYNYPRVHLEADFAGAIVYDDQLLVEAAVERIGTSSWTVAFTARHAPGTPRAAVNEDAKPLATGRTTIVCMDPATQRAAPLPADLRRTLERGRAEV
jgi:4-hydroxybenzoyl-CoA thioesterase/acyl-CoA thioester hydrolase